LFQQFCSILLSLGVALVGLVLVNVNANAKPLPLHALLKSRFFFLGSDYPTKSDRTPRSERRDESLVLASHRIP
jgi:hypothetical protein